jgi:hypothetical protein
MASPSTLKSALIVSQCVVSATLIGLTLYALPRDQGFVIWGGWIAVCVFTLIALCALELILAFRGAL